MTVRALAAVVVLAAAVTGRAADARAQPPGLPEGAGAEVARASCLGCHQADVIAAQRLTQGGWDREVAKMERWGATVGTADRPALVAYLAGAFGPVPAVSHDPGVVAAGEKIFAAACRQCHEDEMSQAQRLTAAAWGREVDKMVRWGARVPADDKPALVAYLTSRWGRR
ncbi:MAG: c-type cytochrome [Vicinamibacterales bacterium]